VSIVGFRRGKLLSLIAGLLMIAGLMGAGGAHAALSFQSVGIGLNQPPTTDASGTNFVLNVDGTFVTPQFQRQAGSHPDLTVSFSLPTSDNLPPESVRDVDVDLPVGFAGGTVGIAECDPAELSGIGGVQAGINCPTAAQVGIVEIHTASGAGSTQVKAPVYNLQHGPDVPARFGFNWLGVMSTITPRVRPGDYGISSGSFAIAQVQPIQSVRVTLWGVPADPIHDSLRAKQGKFLIDGPLYGPAVGCEEGCSFSAPVGISPLYGLLHPNGSATTTDAPAVPLLTEPTACSDQPLAFVVRGDSWEEPGVWDTRTLTADESGVPFTLEGCERVPFDPTANARPLAHAADSPTGLDAEVNVPQPQDPHGISPADVRKVKMTFPQGMSVSPSSAAGLGACSPAQIGLGTNEAPSCPASSDLGTVTIDTPLLAEPLEGRMILATQNDNPFHSLIALYLVAQGPGFYLKLPGKVDLDQNTGQLTATFDNTPQLPFSRLRVHFNGGPQAPLSTPLRCGTYTTRIELTSWASESPVTQESPFEIDENCTPKPFNPSFTAGTTNPQGGQYSPFTFALTREDGMPLFSRIRTALPGGLLANISSVQQCGEAQAAAGSCPVASKIGTTSALAGAGGLPLPVSGSVYLTGPYKGAPFGLSIAVPTAGQAGPFDLGDVVVRAGLYIDPSDTHVTVSADPLPTILQGIPLRLRQVAVDIDRPQFTLNPTNCDRKAILGSFTALEGATSDQSVPFQVSGCDQLGFKPKLKISLKGNMNRTKNPALTATLKAPKGEANIAKTTVILPEAQYIDNSHISNPCTRVQFYAGDCPKGSILGKATAYSPLLDKPLSGPVYFRSNGGARELPDLVADLNGQIHVTLVGFIDSVKTGPETSRVRTRFANVPDAPVSKFTIKLAGGKKGLIENSRNLCSFTPRATVQMTGQNGKAHNTNLKLGTSCGKAKPRKK